ncbi:MAG: MFS transporter [Dehalococcoidia bacterium]|nr:MFS transporter [Dehalococcoidia bacterium]
MRKHNVLFYGWVVVAVAFLISALGYGVRYSFSVIFTALLEQFKWPRDATAAILSFHILAYGFTAPIAGALVDRFGARKTMALGAVLLAAGAAASGLGNTLWHYYLSFGLLMGVGLCLMGGVPSTRIISNWFVTRRGLALSLMFFGSGGAFLLYPLVAFLIERVGWRAAFVLEGVMVAAILLPAVVFLVRSHPDEMGLLPDGARSASADASATKSYERAVVDKEWASRDWTLGKAVKEYRFWMLCLTTFSVWGIAEHIMVTHHVAFAEDAGYSKMYAASVLAFFGVFTSGGALAGMVSDRIGREATFTIATGIGISGIAVLMLMGDSSQPWILYLYSILFGLGFGMTSPCIAASATDMFQGRRAGMVIGFIWFAFALGGATGPWLGGAIFEATGSYLPAFILAACGFVVACISLWIAAPRKVRLVAGRARARQKPGPTAEAGLPGADDDKPSVA